MKKIVKIVILFICIFTLSFLFNNEKNNLKIMADNIGLDDCMVTKTDITTVVSDWVDLTKISFLYEAPEGYIYNNEIINDKVKVYRSNVDEKDIALVYEGKIYLSDDELIDPNDSYPSKPLSSAGLFYGCKKLKSIDFTNFDTSKVTNMNYMFYYCSSLRDLDLRNFNTSQVTSMEAMFSFCDFQELDLSSFDTSNVTNFENMFVCCGFLKKVNLESLKTNSATNMDSMFNSCWELKELDLSNFDTSNVTNMSMMFMCCYALSYLDISQFNMSNIQKYNMMFDECVIWKLLFFPIILKAWNYYQKHYL